MSMNILEKDVNSFWQKPRPFMNTKLNACEPKRRRIAYGKLINHELEMMSQNSCLM